jgi:hypothetical protein
MLGLVPSGLELRIGSLCYAWHRKVFSKSTLFTEDGKARLACCGSQPNRPQESAAGWKVFRPRRASSLGPRLVVRRTPAGRGLVPPPRFPPLMGNRMPLAPVRSGNPVGIRSENSLVRSAERPDRNLM